MKAILEVLKLSRKIKPHLQETTFELYEGESLALVGANGAGKTTLIKCLIGLLEHQGDVFLAGRRFESYSKKELAKLIAYVPQAYDFDCLLTVDHYLALSFFSYSEINVTRKQEAIRLFRLDSFLTQSFESLSSGEKQRVLMACAYCQNPKIYFLDEPFSCLDVSSTDELVEILNQIKRTGSSIVISLHDINLLQLCADRVLQVNYQTFSTEECAIRS